MKKPVSITLVTLMGIALLAAPAAAGGRHHGGHYGRHHHHGGVGFVFGFGLGALLTVPFWYRPAYVYPAYTPVYTPVYTYPVYAPTYPTAPAYAPATVLAPTPQPLAPAPPTGAELAPPPAMTPGSATPPASSESPQSAIQACETVWVEGHYETRVMPNGQRYTTWVPTHSQQRCR